MFSLSLEIQKAKAATSQGPPGMTQVPAPRQKETENEGEKLRDTEVQFRRSNIYLIELPEK